MGGFADALAEALAPGLLLGGGEAESSAAADADALGEAPGSIGSSAKGIARMRSAL